MPISTITKEELKQKIDAGEHVQIVNVLAPSSYDLGLIKGSLKIPVSELDRRLNELDKSREVVTYCAGLECHASREAAEKLAEKGFRVRAYEGGIEEWKSSQLPLEEGAAVPSDMPSGLSGAASAETMAGSPRR